MFGFIEVINILNFSIFLVASSLAMTTTLSDASNWFYWNMYMLPTFGSSANTNAFVSSHSSMVPTTCRIGLPNTCPLSIRKPELSGQTNRSQLLSDSSSSIQPEFDVVQLTKENKQLKLQLQEANAKLQYIEEVCFLCCYFFSQF